MAGTTLFGTSFLTGGKKKKDIMEGTYIQTHKSNWKLVTTSDHIIVEQSKANQKFIFV
jgi:hypothetical protein